MLARALPADKISFPRVAGPIDPECRTRPQLEISYLK
jgi:hypothetical protein